MLYALDTSFSHHFHDGLVCWIVLFATIIYVSRCQFRFYQYRALQDHGKEALLHDHDPRRAANDGVWDLVIILQSAVVYESGVDARKIKPGGDAMDFSWMLRLSARMLPSGRQHF